MKKLSVWAMVLTLLIAGSAYAQGSAPGRYTMIPNATSPPVFDVALPYVNATNDSGAFNTTLVLENTTGDFAYVNTHPADDKVGSPAAEIEAFDTKRIDNWPRTGLGLVHMNVPEGVNAYVEVTLPNKEHFPVLALKKINGGTTVSAFNLRADLYSSFAVLLSDGPARVRYRCYAASALLSTRVIDVDKNSGNLAPCENGTDNRMTFESEKVVVGCGGCPPPVAAPIYAFVLRRSLTFGEWVILPLHQP